MPTPTGTIKLSDVNVELGRSSSTQINLNDTQVRQLAGVPSPQSTISLDNLRGKSFTTFINNPLGFNASTYTDIDAQTGFANISLSLLRNGTFAIEGEMSGSILQGNWTSQTSTTVGDQVYVRFTRSASSSISSGGGATATTGWLQLNTTQQISVFQIANTSVEVSSTGIYTVELSTSSTGATISSTSTVTLRARARLEGNSQPL